MITEKQFLAEIVRGMKYNNGWTAAEIERLRGELKKSGSVDKQ